MKAMTLWQPHASLIEFGWKEVETRDWYTGYRGPLAIHSAKRFTGADKQSCERIAELTRIYTGSGSEIEAVFNRLEFGCVLCTCDLVACVPTTFARESAHRLRPPFEPRRGWQVEQIMGNYAPGRWAWILRNVKPLAKHIEARGYQKLWTWTERSA